MADAVRADVEKVLDAVAVRPVAHGLALLGGLGVFRRGHVVDHRLDFGGIENAVLADRDQIVDRDRSGDFMAENAVEREHPHAVRRLVDDMSVENLLCDSFSHFVSLAPLVE